MNLAETDKFASPQSSDWINSVSMDLAVTAIILTDHTISQVYAVYSAED